VISSPIVTTQNNNAATITQGTTTPVFVPQVVQSQGGIVTTTQVLPVSANTGLIVIPRVNRDGTITVQGTVNVASILRIVSSPDGSTIAPEINQTQLNGFNRRVASGETLVIGGLNSKTESEDENRVPLLSQIPIIGKLFRGRSRNSQDSQLLIFLTPQIVGDRASTGETPP
jgi:type II secretory pathway component HofQ